MPFRSKAQRRKFYVLHNQGEISDATLAEWNRETKKQKKPLSEKVDKSFVRDMRLMTLDEARVRKAAEQAGAAPAKNTPPMPAYADIYYSPLDPEQDRRDEEALVNRRRSQSRRSSGVYGVHGAAQPTAELRYSTEEQFLQPRGALNPVQRPKVQTPALDRMRRKPISTTPDVPSNDPTLRPKRKKKPEKGRAV